MANVLFVCLHNAGRSQMSEALFNRVSKGSHEARSAGTSPATDVNPRVVRAMREIGFDLSNRKPKALTDELVRWADVVVTMGCGDECPFIPGKRYIDWELPDPSSQSLEGVRETRDRIAKLTHDLVGVLPGTAATGT